MTTITLRSLGGSVVMTVPKKYLNAMDLSAGSQVSVTTQDGKLIIERKAKPHYKLADLMARCDLNQPFSTEEQEWLADTKVGDEEI